ncbi:MAG: hypothetical protein J6O54_02330 [Prevotella sp.]|nr:hypothetical protein [Prevotella sp.]
MAIRFFLCIFAAKDVEEALADLEEGEREFLRGETFSHREVMKMIWDKIATEKDLAVT